MKGRGLGVRGYNGGLGRCREQTEQGKAVGEAAGVVVEGEDGSSGEVQGEMKESLQAKGLDLDQTPRKSGTLWLNRIPRPMSG